ncbi:MAG: Inner membrane protein YbjJ [Chroococcidiopsis cubana SAG 39.79]|uniref:MFS transporter n=1 Tax=Chroococcidiopsis cubana SAG 39.79 TaxID=388085 RepID=A0AB37UBM1_9CYAN|nr:MFS transporter [Chroococcidiopsis cubana]MDZ4877659.1 Inner membrane protein YbjJ [Chroococcidiopsis cubana SAG 39.79]PSB63551.1 MFS transporter [Chroococcidiopsis cubana CCALA 043]RUT04558.1 MFS transporter [Chroococcidiopsis cubana SAG 39.79]
MVITIPRGLTRQLPRGLTRQPRQKSVLRTARFAIAAMFFINGAVSGNWVARIPAIQQKLALSNSDFAAALLGMPIGMLLVTPIAGWLIARVGSRPIIKIATLVYCLVLFLVALAPQQSSLAIALVLFGAINGIACLAMNAQGLAIQQRYNRPLMASFHGMASVGNLVGAAVGGVAASLGVAPVPHLLGAALLLGIVAILKSRRLLPSVVVSISQAPVFAFPQRSLVGLGIVAFCGLLAEGAMANWSANYLLHVLDTGPGLAAQGYAAFSLAMACGRFTGDRSTQYFGPVRMVCFGGTLAAIGLMLSLVVSQPIVAIFGFACCGIGLSSIAPLVFSAAERTPGIAPGMGLAAVATIGYFGACSSSLLGFATDWLTLRGALGLVVVSSATIAVLAPTVKFCSKIEGDGVNFHPKIGSTNLETIR